MDIKNMEVFNSSQKSIAFHSNNIEIHSFSSLIIIRNIYINGTDQFLGIDGIEISNANLIKRADGYFLYVTTYWNKDKL